MSYGGASSRNIRSPQGRCVSVFESKSCTLDSYYTIGEHILERMMYSPVHGGKATGNRVFKHQRHENGPPQELPEIKDTHRPGVLQYAYA